MGLSANAKSSGTCGPEGKWMIIDSAHGLTLVLNEL